MFLSLSPNGDWRLLCKTRGKLKPPDAIRLVNIEGVDDVSFGFWTREDGIWLGRPESDESAYDVLERIGRVPLPPYIRKGEMVESDRGNY